MPHELDKQKICADIYARAFAGICVNHGYAGAGQIAGRAAVRDFAKLMHDVFPRDGWNVIRDVA